MTGAGAGAASLSPKARRLRPVVKERLRCAIARDGAAGVALAPSRPAPSRPALSRSPKARLLTSAVVKLRLRRTGGAAAAPSARACGARRVKERLRRTPERRAAPPSAPPAAASPVNPPSARGAVGSSARLAAAAERQKQDGAAQMRKIKESEAQLREKERALEEKLAAQEASMMAEMQAKMDAEMNARAEQMEREFAEKFGVKHAVAFNSGTSTLHAPLIAVGVEPGDALAVLPEAVFPPAIAVICTNQDSLIDEFFQERSQLLINPLEAVPLLLSATPP